MNIVRTIDELLGQTILALWMTSDNTYVAFQTDEDFFYYYTAGDCCSSSWIEHISGLQALLGSPIAKIDQPPAHEVYDNNTEEFGTEYIQVYSIKLFTANGVCELEMRNSSNGYYGGTFEPIVMIEGIDDLNMKRIVQDF